MNGEVDGNSMGRTNALVNLRKKRFHKVAMRLFCLNFWYVTLTLSKKICRVFRPFLKVEPTFVHPPSYLLF